MVEGDLNELGVRESTLRESGGFEAIEIEQIMTSDEIIEVMGRAKSLAGDYAAPNRDEIDRMLLER